MISLRPVISISLLLAASLSLHGQIQKGADIDGETGGDLSGISVSMPDANTVAIGARSNYGTAFHSGHVRVYSWSGSVWVQKGADIDGEGSNNWAGFSVSMPDSNTVAIGAPQNLGTGLSVSGHARVYSWSSATGAWVQKGADLDGEGAGDRSGTSVSMPDPNTVAIGAPENNGTGPNAGHVRIYRWNGSFWVQKGTDIDGEAPYDLSGFSVSMPDSNTVAIGAKHNVSSGISKGHVRVFTWSGIAWIQKGADIDGEASNDRFGSSVSMPDINTVAIGAPYNSGSGLYAGHVRIYTWSGGEWVQKGKDIDGETADDQSGWSVSMPDNNTVAIGANWNGGTAYQAGHVRIHTWDSSGWVQRGIDIDGEAEYDNSGISVSMPDSQTVATGAHFNWGSGVNSGHVRVYDLSLAVNIPNVNFQNEIVLYPNPTQRIFTIEPGETYSKAEVVARNELGQVVKRQMYFHSGKIEFVLPEHPGVYFIEVTVDNKKAVLKAIRE